MKTLSEDGRRLVEEGITTASGWLTHRLGGFPKEGDAVIEGDCELRVEAVDDRRVARLSVTRVTGKE